MATSNWPTRWRSSVDEHARFGGVVPEVASRAHLEAMTPSVDRALAQAGVTLADVDAIAVTAGPGLAGALLVGVAAAKAYALTLGKPLYGVNHLAAHVAVDQLEHGPLPAPVIALLVSGGHSSLLLVPDVAGEVISLGATVDDAAGEAYDKVGPGAGPPVPGWAAHRQGGPVRRSGRDRVPAGEVPRWVARLLVRRTQDGRGPVGRGTRRPGRTGPGGRCSRVLQEAVADVLTRKAVAACLQRGVGHLVIGGGVAANSRLRALAEERCTAAGIRLRVPRPGLCTDNGAMVAALGSELASRGLPSSPLDLPADSALPHHRGSRPLARH